MVTKDGWKYVCTPNDSWQLFNVAEDPFEQANHVFNERFREELERCHDLLAQWIATTGDSFPLPDIELTERGTPAEQYHAVIKQRAVDDTK